MLTIHVSSETIRLLCFCVLFSNIYPKIKFTAKNWSDLHVRNFYSKVTFWNFCLRKYFFTFLYWIIDVLQQYCENFRKTEQAELVENLSPSYLPGTLQISA